MRTYTFALSLAAHAALIGFAIVAPLFATGDLPDPPRSSTFMLVTTDVPDVPPPAPRPAGATRHERAEAAPLAPPDGITPETPRTLGDLVVDDRAVAGLGIPDALISGSGVIEAPPLLPRTLQDPIRPGGVIQAPRKIHHVAPEYPSIARSARVSGTVILEAVLAEDGTVQDVRVLRSIKLLDDAAIDAVRQWRFTPTLLNGQPQRVLMTVTVTFALN